MLVLVKRAMDSRKLTRDFRELKEEVKKRFEPGVNIIGTSSNMQKVYKTIGQVVDTHATILIQGESGTGKELVAKTIHYNSPRWNQPFVAINCAAIPRDLLESELFGHEKGAFTGAMDRRIGKFELAEAARSFWTKSAISRWTCRPNFLRVLQDHEYSRVGGRDMFKADVRILAATNQDLEKAVKEKRFREDLYFRLKVIPIYLPPLRERQRRYSTFDRLLHRQDQPRDGHSDLRHFAGSAETFRRALLARQRSRAGKHPDPRRGAVLRPDPVSQRLHLTEQTGGRLTSKSTNCLSKRLSATSLKTIFGERTTSISIIFIHWSSKESSGR